MDIDLAKVENLSVSPFLQRIRRGSPRTRDSTSSLDSGLDLGPDSVLEEEEEWERRNRREIELKSTVCLNHCGAKKKISLCDILSLLDDHKSFREELDDLYEQNYNLNHLLSNCALKVESFSRKLLSVEYQLSDFKESERKRLSDSSSPKDDHHDVVKTFKFKFEVPKQPKIKIIKDLDTSATVQGIVDAEIEMLSDKEDDGKMMSDESENYRTKNGNMQKPEPVFTFKYQTKVNPEPVHQTKVVMTPEPAFSFSYKPGNNVIATKNDVTDDVSAQKNSAVKISTPLVIRNTPFAFSARSELNHEQTNSLAMEEFVYEKQPTFSPNSIKQSTELELSLLGDDPVVESSDKSREEIKITFPKASSTGSCVPIKFLEHESALDTTQVDGMFEDKQTSDTEDDSLMGNWVNDIFRQYQKFTITKVDEDQDFTHDEKTISPVEEFKEKTNSPVEEFLEENTVLPTPPTSFTPPIRIRMLTEAEEEQIVQDTEEVDKLLEDLEIVDGEESYITPPIQIKYEDRPTRLHLKEIKDNDEWSETTSYRPPDSPSPFDLDSDEERRERWRERPFGKRAARNFFSRLFACWHN